MLAHVVALLAHLITKVLGAARHHWFLKLFVSGWLLVLYLVVTRQLLLVLVGHENGVFISLHVWVNPLDSWSNDIRLRTAPHILELFSESPSTDEVATRIMIIYKHVWLNIADLVVIFRRIVHQIIIGCLVSLLQIACIIRMQSCFVSCLKDIIRLLHMIHKYFAGRVIALNIRLIMKHMHFLLVRNLVRSSKTPPHLLLLPCIIIGSLE